uniref:PLAC domain-containing protein n=1 Tax=Esox lucius TaxID=8010 RepID=A0A6Q2ZMB0_ESOLU
MRRWSECSVNSLTLVIDTRRPICQLFLLMSVLLKVPQRAEPQQQEAGGEQGRAPGSWGSWGPWTSCSLSCGGGVQEQVRPCLPSYTPSLAAAAYPSRPGGHQQRHPHQKPGRRASAQKSTVPLRHNSPGRPLHSDTVGQAHREGVRGQQSATVKSQQRRSPLCASLRGGDTDSQITPGKYGFGKMPYVVPLQTDTGLTSGTEGTGKAPSHKQRRSPISDSSLSTSRHGGYRPNHRRPLYNNPRVHSYSPVHSQIPVSQARPRPNLSSNSTPQSQANSNPAWSSSLYQPGQMHLQTRQEPQPSYNPTSTAQQPQGRPYNPLPNSACSGEYNQYRICNTNACPPASGHIRAVQCSSYNSRPFMGRLYEWEPFNEVPGDQHCELNCRAIGFRFYVRQSDRVIDGTPCGRNETSICVAGRCQSLGCDEYLGSGKMMDKCGVCGGDNTACKLVSGLFQQHSLNKVGYHKVVEIPEGATKINVTETVKSQNYLALRSRSGRSIINGNWAIDRPGKYEGVGTMFTYRRPNEITSTAGESFLADGPTNEILDVYVIYQQPNPGISYEFILPSAKPPQYPDHRNPVHPQQPNHRPGAGGGKYPSHLPDNQVPAVQPPRRQREYNWKLAGATECSSSCGRGSRYTIFHCVHRMSHEQAPENHCDSSTRPNSQEEPCNVQPCPAFWDIGEWSECSKKCGLGMQHRQVLCRHVYANRTLNVHASLCRHLEQPETSSTCQLKICSEWQINTEWSCSVPCGVGQRTREVQCVSNVGDVVSDDECNMKLRPSDKENCDMGPCAKSWFFTDWGNKCSAECGMGVQTRGVLCLTDHISSLPLEGCGHQRPAASQVCNNGPCENRIEWFTGPWSQCSAECGSGSQQRAVVCLMKSDEGFNVMPPYECSSLDKPPNQQSCHHKNCGAKWYHTDWSACSKTCEGGFRVREVRCLSDDTLSSEACEEQLKPREREDCNPGPCVPHIDENCRDKYFNCNVVVQARLCVYDYYKTTCCASCTRVADRQSHHRGRS